MILRSLICILILLANLTLADENQPEYFIKRNENQFKQRDYPKLYGADYSGYALLYVLDGGKRYLIEPNRYDWYLDSFYDNTPSKILFQKPSPTIIKKTSSAILCDLLVNNSRYMRVLNIDAEKCLGKAQSINQGKLA